MPSLFKQRGNEMAYLKAGFMGLQGSGKTHTACLLAIGLHGLLSKKGLPGGDKPVFFVDTETGSDWAKRDFDAAGITFEVAKTRSFADLTPMVKEVAAQNGILIIDSVTHFWRELTESYARKKKRFAGLQFQDWAFLKTEWGKFTDEYVNSSAHIVMCGRAGYEYSNVLNEETGKKELSKDGIKMKAEGETGYEPSILVLMERHQSLDAATGTPSVWRQAVVMKDRSRELDGKMFRDPTFATFQPHIRYLNLGGEHVGVETERNSESLIPGYEPNRWKQRDVALAEIKEMMVKHHPGRSADEQAAKADLLEEAFGHRSWEKVQTLNLETVENGRNAVWLKLEGKPYDLAAAGVTEAIDEFMEGV